MGLDSPAAWGGGSLGFGKRLASSQATRAIRQGMALGLDTLLVQDPIYVNSYQHGWVKRLEFAAKQTLVSRDQYLEWKPAWWRIYSALGSEAISQGWRPSALGWKSGMPPPGWRAGHFASFCRAMGNGARFSVRFFSINRPV